MAHDLGRDLDQFLPQCHNVQWRPALVSTAWRTKLPRLWWFKKAMAIDAPPPRRGSIDDPDLKPLWDSMGGGSWKRME
jgi:hypothetical protein